MVTQDQDHLYVIKSSQLKSWKYIKSWTILTVNYDDVVEAVDLYNLDVEECTTAWLPHGYKPDDYFVSN